MKPSRAVCTVLPVEGQKGLKGRNSPPPNHSAALAFRSILPRDRRSNMKQSPLQGGSQHDLCLRELAPELPTAPYSTPAVDFIFPGLTPQLACLFPGGVTQIFIPGHLSPWWPYRGCHSYHLIIISGCGDTKRYPRGFPTNRCPLAQQQP